MDSEPYTNEVGTTTWCNRSGQRHREDGPAVEYDDGSEEWYINGVLHRDGGPAVYAADGFTAWYQQGQLHREDGAARQWAFEGEDEWWWHGQRIEAPAGATGPAALAASPRSAAGVTAVVRAHDARDVVERARRARVDPGGSTAAVVATPVPRRDAGADLAHRVDWGR